MNPEEGLGDEYVCIMRSDDGTTSLCYGRTDLYPADTPPSTITEDVTPLAETTTTVAGVAQARALADTGAMGISELLVVGFPLVLVGIILLAVSKLRRRK